MIRSVLRELGFAAIRWGLPVPGLQSLQKLRELHQIKAVIDSLDVNCVFDVGANEGGFSDSIRRIGYTGTIHAFEPIPQECRKMAERSARDDALQIHELALGSENKTQTFNMNYVQGTSTFSSFLEPAANLEESFFSFSDAGTRVAQTVQVIRADDVLPRVTPEGQKMRIFLKVDTQGYESEVLDGFGDKISEVVALYIELPVVPIYAGMTPYTEMIARLERSGFSLIDLFVENRTRWGGVLEYNCLMAKEAEMRKLLRRNLGH